MKKRLSPTSIRSIYVGYFSGEPKIAIARRLDINHATVHYHLKKIEHLDETKVYALLAPPCGEGHTSFKCVVCGRAHDNIMSEEFQEIRRLRSQIAALKHQLSLYEPISQGDDRPNPISTVRL